MITIQNSSGHQWKPGNLGKNESRSEERSYEGEIPARPVAAGREDLGEDETRRARDEKRVLASGECTRVGLGTWEMREIVKPLRFILKPWTKGEICWII